MIIGHGLVNKLTPMKTSAENNDLALAVQWEIISSKTG